MLLYVAYHICFLIGYNMYKTAQFDWWPEVEVQNI